MPLPEERNFREDLFRSLGASKQTTKKTHKQASKDVRENTSKWERLEGLG